MSSSSSSSSSPSASLAKQELIIFHTIDRELYAKLLHNLGRDPAESMQVIALWLWLEQIGLNDNLVRNVLALPDSIINAIADETVTCLNVSHNNQLPPLPSTDEDSIPLLQSLTKPPISLGFFQAQRVAVIGGVAKLVNQVCTIAFEDIVQQKLRRTAGSSMVVGPADHLLEMGTTMKINWETKYPKMKESTPPSPPPPPPSPLHSYGIGGSSSGTLNSEVSQRLSRLNLPASVVRPIPPDERTIFLTFSKGYPITKNEIREFFTRNYGEFIEGIHMQEVNEASEQPLYARLVSRSPAIIEQVLEGNRKAKFSINGKHVWARRFVRRSSSPSPPDAPHQASTQNYCLF